MLVSASGGIDRFFWYAWDSKRMGAIGSKSGMPNEVADAYATVQRWLVSSKVTCDFDIKRPTWICKLAREGRTATVRFQSGAFEQKPTDSMVRYVLGGDVEFASNDGRAW